MKPDDEKITNKGRMTLDLGTALRAALQAEAKAAGITAVSLLRQILSARYKPKKRE